MILTCRYCLYQKHLCPRCEGPVVVKTINELANGEIHSCSIILCLNLSCSNYGEFKVQTVNAVVDTDFVCPECTEKVQKGELV
jgi:uncharacterized protein YlaI